MIHKKEQIVRKFLIGVDGRVQWILMIKIPYHNVDQTVVCKKVSTYNFVFRPKMAIFRRAGMMEGGLPLPLAMKL